MSRFPLWDMIAEDRAYRAPALLMLTALLERPDDELAGADIRALTNVATGTLYPILLRLEDAGWLASQWEEVDSPRELADHADDCCRGAASPGCPKHRRATSYSS